MTFPKLYPADFLIRMAKIAKNRRPPISIFGAMDACPSDQLIYGNNKWHVCSILFSRSQLHLDQTINDIESSVNMRRFCLKKWSHMKNIGTKKKLLNAIIYVFKKFGGGEVNIHLAQEKTIRRLERMMIEDLNMDKLWTMPPDEDGEYFNHLGPFWDGGSTLDRYGPLRRTQSLAVLWMAYAIHIAFQRYKRIFPAAGLSQPNLYIFTDYISSDDKRCLLRQNILTHLLTNVGGLVSVRVHEEQKKPYDLLGDIFSGWFQNTEENADSPFWEERKLFEVISGASSIHYLEPRNYPVILNEEPEHLSIGIQQAALSIKNIVAGHRSGSEYLRNTKAARLTLAAGKTHAGLSLGR